MEALIDCDVHIRFDRPWTEVLGPYMEPGWKTRLEARVVDDPRFGLPDASLATGLTLGWQSVGSPTAAPISGQDLGEMVFDRAGASKALALVEDVMGMGAFPNPLMAGVVAAAVNDWMADTWLARDSRWVGAVVLAPQDSEASVREIERWAGDSRMIGAFLPVGRLPVGMRSFDAIFRALDDADLPLILHPSATEGIYAESAPLAGGPPQSAMELRLAWRQPFQRFVGSLVAHGFFEKYPRLRLLLAEVGFAWLPDLMWNLDQYWRGSRDETPWVLRPPSEYIQERVRLTTRPYFQGTGLVQQHQMLDMANAQRVLLFGSGSPHATESEVHGVIDALPSTLRSSVLSESAHEFFPRIARK